MLFFVGIPGFEPGMTGPESVVLPLHHIPISKQLFSELRCKGNHLFPNTKHFWHFFSKTLHFQERIPDYQCKKPKISQKIREATEIANLSKQGKGKSGTVFARHKLMATTHGKSCQIHIL